MTLNEVALEQAAKVKYETHVNDPDEPENHEFFENLPQFFQDSHINNVAKIITAYLAGVEADIRAKVDAFGEAKFNEGISDIAGESGWGDTDPVEEAERALYAAIGYEVGE